MSEAKRLERIEKQLQTLTKEQAVMTVLMSDYNALLKEHIKRTRQLEDWVITHKTTHESKWALVKDLGILAGIGVALARLFGLL